MTVFDTARNEIEEAIRSGVIDTAEDAPAERRVVLSRGIARLSPARAAELRERIKALEDEFGEEPDPGAEAYGVVFAVYPMPRPDEAAAGGDETRVTRTRQRWSER